MIKIYLIMVELSSAEKRLYNTLVKEGDLLHVYDEHHYLSIKRDMIILEHLEKILHKSLTFDTGRPVSLEWETCILFKTIPQKSNLNFHLLICDLFRQQTELKISDYEIKKLFYKIFPKELIQRMKKTHQIYN